MIVGSTGNLYRVHLNKVPTCTCPDFTRTGDLCKHIFYVTLQVIGLGKDDYRSYQRAYTDTEIFELMQLLRANQSLQTVMQPSAIPNMQFPTSTFNNDDQSTWNI
jgi:uncharacterized Zn finger protein